MVSLSLAPKCKQASADPEAVAEPLTTPVLPSCLLLGLTTRGRRDQWEQGDVGLGPSISKDFSA